jgi:hypothetical protein
MIIYDYRENGEYAGTREKNHVPGHATTVAPPATAEHQAAVFDPATKTWRVVADWREAEYYAKADGKKVEFALGDAPDDTMIPTPRPTPDYVWEGDGWVLPLAAAKRLKLAEISGAYRMYDATGRVMTSLGFPIQIGQEHCNKLDGAIRLVQALGQETTYITDADDVTHYGLTLAQAQQALLEQAGAAAAAHARKQELRALVEAATTLEEVEAIKWAT